MAKLVLYTFAIFKEPRHSEYRSNHANDAEDEQGCAQEQDY